MKVQNLQINSILGGVSGSPYLFASGQYLNAIGYDPDLPISDNSNDYLSSGILRPSAFAKFSDAQVTGTPKFILTNPKNALAYAYLDNGRVVSYDSSLASETLVATASSSTGNGGFYYNNYFYFVRGTEIDRYGPLNGSPAYTTGVWTGATLGSQTALTDTTYPTMRDSVVMPNHVGVVHGDGAAYFLDYKDGVGMVHKIKTTKVTAEGDTDNGSSYNVLDLPFGYIPTTIESYDSYLVIGAVQTTNGTVNQGSARLFFWDSIQSSFEFDIPVSDPIISRVQNVNGTLFIYSGGLNDGGYRVSYYAGGRTIKTVYFSDDGHTPLHGAVTAIGDKVIWGTIKKVQTKTSPEYYAVAMSYGSKNPNIGGGAHCIAKTTITATSTQGIVGAIGTPLQGTLSRPQIVIGWKDDSAFGIDKPSSTYGTSIFHAPTVQVGRKFIIRRIRINFPVAIAANMTIEPKVFTDNFSTSSTVGLKTINNTNYPNGERFVEFKPDINGINNFVLELRSTGTALLPINLPIEIDVEPILD